MCYANREDLMTALAIRIGSALVLAASVVTPAAAQVDVYARGGVIVRTGTVQGEAVVRTARRPAARRRYDRSTYRGNSRFATPRGRARPRPRPRRVGRARAAYYFCHAGNGHPRFGWSWCVDDGYVRPRPYFGWARWTATYDDVWFREFDRLHDLRRLNEHALRRLLGRREFHRLRAHSRGHGRLYGEWMDPGDGAVSLAVYAGGRPFAELRDQNCDGLVDVTFIKSGRAVGR